MLLALQVFRGDVSELWRMDLQDHVYAYTPFCDSNTATDGFRSESMFDSAPVFAIAPDCASLPRLFLLLVFAISSLCTVLRSHACFVFFRFWKQGYWKVRSTLLQCSNPSLTRLACCADAVGSFARAAVSHLRSLCRRFGQGKRMSGCTPLRFFSRIRFASCIFLSLLL